MQFPDVRGDTALYGAAPVKAGVFLGLGDSRCKISNNTLKFSSGLCPFSSGFRQVLVCAVYYSRVQFVDLMNPTGIIFSQQVKISKLIKDFPLTFGPVIRKLFTDLEGRKGSALERHQFVSAPKSHRDSFHNTQRKAIPFHKRRYTFRQANKDNLLRTSKLAQWADVPAAEPDNLNSLPGTHTVEESQFLQGSSGLTHGAPTRVHTPK